MCTQVGKIDYAEWLAYVKGDVGEIVTATELRHKCDMRLVRTLYLPNDNHFTEVDMIGVTDHGLYVIENKNYSGVVKGSISDKYWTIYYNSYSSNKLYNPVLQNRLHTACLKKYLDSYDLNIAPIFNVVIFNDKTKLNIGDDVKNVFTLSEFVDKYNEYKSGVVLSTDLLNKIFDLLSELSNPSDEMRLLHKSLLKGD